ncbi:MAG: hypothetical protein OWR52_12415 [Acidibacillus sp.]|uniref:Uncharacterized protein n=1 Tax=Sulfoacidibacillus ferrooxidans TaxID=2005001 RepID=A0A9X2ACM8_9BACL|nr:hypothetical protein [Sulfoacidibacillus ferrooxidans]MCI0184343.1 hypothetical protein [Sulfoacidibacillus ferrooxidans]MCY0894288.1 hypothetical protein [Acidibacillus sp.]
MIQQILEVIVLGVFAFFAIWLYSGVLNASPYGDAVKKKAMIRNMRNFGAVLIAYALIIGSFYRFHVLSLTWAVILYIPVIAGFFTGMHRLQPYLRPDKEEAHNDRTYIKPEQHTDDD